MNTLKQTLGRAPRMTEEQFRVHSKQIFKKISGKWFSFGDEALMEEAYLKIERTREGRKVIEGMLPSVVISSKELDGAWGQYTHQRRTIDLDTDIISSKSDEKFGAIEVLLHEMRHECQVNRGLTVDGRKASIDQLITTDKLSEAETMAWDQVNRMTYLLVDRKDFGSRVDLADFKKVDYAKRLRQLGEENPNTFNEMRFERMASVASRLQKNYQKTGDFDKAQRLTVGTLMKDNMRSKNHPTLWWQKGYDRQAVNNMFVALSKGDVSEKGDAANYNKILKHYAAEYGLKPSDLAQTGLGMELREIVKDAKDLVKKNPQMNTPEAQTQVNILYGKYTRMIKANDTLSQQTLKNKLSALSSPNIPTVLPPERAGQRPQKEGIAPAVLAHLQGQKIA